MSLFQFILVDSSEGEIDQLLMLRCADEREIVLRQRYTFSRVHRGRIPRAL